MTLDFSTVLPSGTGVYTVFDMSEDEIKIMDERLKPGGYSAEGFLAKNEDLKSVCVKDLTTLLKLKISCEDISLTLKGLVVEADKIAKTFLHTRDIMIGNFQISGSNIATNGTQACPFHKEKTSCHEGRRDFTVTNLKTNRSFTFSELVVDLIGKHAFFEGNTPYRADPEQICRVLELEAGKIEKITEKSLKWVSGDLEINEKEEQMAQTYASKRTKLNEAVIVYYEVPYVSYKQFKNRGLKNIEIIQNEARERFQIESKQKEFIAGKLNFYKTYIQNWDPNGIDPFDESKRYVHIFVKKKT